MQEIAPPRGGHSLAATIATGLLITSTALADEGRSRPLGTAPEGFHSPPLDWFRGLDIELAIEQAKLSLDAEVLMQRQARGEK